MKLNFRKAAALFALIMLLPVVALADQFAVVKGGRLNLRQYPSAQSASLGKYDTGTWVKVLFSGQSGFAQVQTMNGKTGYMHENYLDYGVGTANTGTVKYANGGYVNLRTGPALTYSVAMRVTSGTTITIVNDTNEWNYVMVTANGSSVWGYMHDSFIDRGYAGTAVVTTKNGGKVNVRSGPSSAYKSIGSLRSGTKVTVLLKGNGWYQIAAEGLTGFMSTGYLSGSGSTAGTNTGTVSSTTAYVNNPKSTQVLNLRESPSQSARSIGQYRNGTQVKVVAYGATWCEVYVGTRHGYMMTRYLSFTGSYLPPSYPQNTPVYVYPQNTPVYVYPVTTPTPTPLVQYITPKPQGSTGGPKAGTAGTLAVAAGSGNTQINVYTTADMTSVKATYPAGTAMTILQYDVSSCMILVGGQVGYVSTWNVNY